MRHIDHRPHITNLHQPEAFTPSQVTSRRYSSLGYHRGQYLFETSGFHLDRPRSVTTCRLANLSVLMPVRFTVNRRCGFFTGAAVLMGALVVLHPIWVTEHKALATSSVLHLVFEGSKYGGWWFDDSVLGNNPIVYSFGLGEDTSWDERMLARGAQVYGFDPTTKAAAYVSTRKELRSQKGQFYYVQKGIAKSKGTLDFTLPLNPEHVSVRQGKHDGLGTFVRLQVDSLQGFMTENGHTHIDILKMDVEGAEYDVLEDFIQNSYFPFTQLLVEFHQRFESVDANRHARLLRDLQNYGFFVTKSRADQEFSFKKII